MANTANPTSSFLWFIVITILYTFIDYNGSKTLNAPNNTKTSYFAIYALLIIVGEYVMNISLTNQLCGSNQYGSAMLVTIVPWVFMFGSISLLLNAFPGWLSPFSNTFGYAIALMAGLSNVLADILKPKITKGSQPLSAQDESMMETLAHIYSDKSMLINEITPNNFNTFWSEMSGIMQPSAVNNKDLMQSLYSIVVLKDTVSKFIWYILTGALVISVGYNYLVNTGCSQSASDMQKKHTEYEQELAEQSTNKDNISQRVYSSSE